jgi:formyl-CoA transferase
MTLPLDGIKVVELGQNFAGPLTGQILGMLGADVVKVERPEKGDDARGWGPPFVDESAAVSCGQPEQAIDHAQPQGSAASRLAQGISRAGRRHGAEPATGRRG